MHSKTNPNEKEHGKQQIAELEFCQTLENKNIGYTWKMQIIHLKILEETENMKKEYTIIW